MKPSPESVLDALGLPELALVGRSDCEERPCDLSFRGKILGLDTGCFVAWDAIIQRYQSCITSVSGVVFAREGPNTFRFLTVPGDHWISTIAWDGVELSDVRVGGEPVVLADLLAQKDQPDGVEIDFMLDDDGLPMRIRSLRVVPGAADRDP